MELEGKVSKSFCHIYGQLDQTGEQIGEELAHMFDLGLICDASVSFNQAELYHDEISELQRRGGLVAPSICPVDFVPTYRDPNWWKYSKEECLQLLCMAQERFTEMGLGPLVAVTTYTPGNGFVAACRQIGIRYIMGFCAPTVGEDGGWEISHYGAPLSAYFVSEDDYRKPENPAGRPDAVMMVNMELRSPLVCLKHWNEGPFGPLNSLAADRWLEPTGEPLPYLAIAEDWLRLAEMTCMPRFLNINLQYFFAGRCYEHNRRALEWIAEQKERGRVEAGSIQEWARQVEQTGGFIEQLTYWRGEMMGFHPGGRPGSVPDMVVDERLERQAVWQYPHATPRRFYDYTKTWHYPAFQPDGSAPSSEEFSEIEVKTKLLSEEGYTRHYKVVVHNTGKVRRVPLALWDLLEDCAGPFSVETPPDWKAGVLPHPAGTTGIVLLEGDCEIGESRLELRVSFTAKRPCTHLQRWGHLLEAQTFIHRRRPYTVLVTQTPERFSVMVRLRRLPRTSQKVRVESLCGIEYEERKLPASGIPLLFDGSRLVCWHRFWDVTADQLVIEGIEEVETLLQRRTAELVTKHTPAIKVGEHGYHLFGDITDKSRWDRKLARAVGEVELGRINEWFKRQRPDAGEVVVEVHPGIYLPPGSVTHALGHEFDDILCAPGYTFKELCVDYSQSWDWGVAAWVQWRHLTLQIKGLRAEECPYTLYLHACDPENRDISQRVHLFNPESVVLPGGQRRELCVIADWVLPQGLEGRWDLSSLSSIRLPEECIGWKALGIWIVPLEKKILYDWVAERGSPGTLCHAWLVKGGSY